MTSHRLGLGPRIVDFGRRLWTKALDDDAFFMAGAVAFDLLVALVPLLVLGIGVAGYVLSAQVADPAGAILALVADYLPAAAGDLDVLEFLRRPVNELVERRGGLTLLGTLFLVWIATRLVGSLRSVLRQTFDEERSRGPVAGKLFDVQVVVAGLLLLTLNLGVTVALRAAVELGTDALGLGDPVLGPVRIVLGHAVAFASIWTLFAIVYRYLPARRIPWRTAVVAATFSAVLHELLKEAFTWYATDVADYGSAFGSLATVAALIFWIYYEAVVFILGGEVAQVYTMPEASRLAARPPLSVEEGGR